MDTSALEARNGKDIQGIPWERLNFTRDKYRETRLKQYKNYENLSCPREELGKKCKEVEKGHNFYDFQFNTRLVKSTIVHFQLRNLLWATSKHDVYLMQNHSVMHWSSVLRRSTEVLNVSKLIVPTLNYPGSLAQTLSRVQISTMAVKDNLLVAGGFHGELICKYLNQSGVAFSTKMVADENAITNAVDIFHMARTWVVTANNDAQVRVFDAGNFACLGRFSYPWSVNNTSVSPDGKLLAVLGDSSECLIADAQSGKVLGNLKGHLDYSFASAWHPDGRILATGNQDTTCRLWDIRNLSESVSVLKGNMGAIRAIKFTSDGRFMAMAEPADFIHIFDTQSDYAKSQEIDLFGEIAGISFSPDTEALFVGVSDRTYGSLLEFKRRYYNHYLDSIL
ncbi:transducin/WD40 repeat-like superfamily protein [Actinidia rufa]|uniref:Transducin/WD40 repeat-like superfamily protein n=1 Tax=Actinidia rufa TaxID=165716 RepID=A0A7J0FCQ3_9ERIC|nr:transducin/WD40 repeat-like superfamily protein [Actinidia rufa]